MAVWLTRTGSHRWMSRHSACRWLETVMDVVVVVPGLVEEAMTMEEVVHRLLVLSMVVLMSAVEWTPGVAVHGELEDPLHGADYLHLEGHGPRR